MITSSNAQVVHTTAKQFISRSGGDKNGCKETKVKNVHEKLLQVAFWTVKYANKQIAISIVGAWVSFLSPNSDALELMQSCIT